MVAATKTHGTLLVFPLNGHGRPAASPVVTPSGTVPFALSFDRSRHLLVVDATGFASSYTVNGNGSLTLISKVGPTGQAAACWTVFVRGTLYAVITRPDGTKRSRRGQVEIYAQFMLIFLGKATVYARVRNRDLPPSLLTFVG